MTIWRGENTSNRISLSLPLVQRHFQMYYKEQMYLCMKIKSMRNKREVIRKGHFFS